MRAPLRKTPHNLSAVLDLLDGGSKGVVLTGSVFEQNEGAGEPPLVAFSPYGLSKGLTAEVVRHRCHEFGLRYGKFVIPNPFGPLEEPRFCAYLIRSWKKGEVAQVNTPDYVRDNIHVSLLAAAYAKFVAKWRSGRKGGTSSTRADTSRHRGHSPNASPPPCARGLG